MVLIAFGGFSSDLNQRKPASMRVIATRHRAMESRKQNPVFELWLAAYESHLIEIAQGTHPAGQDPSPPSTNPAGPAPEAASE
jgi:hypothetical protein